ncbi:MAG: DUF434 domain-containing protein [Sedimentisphaerales bacterium]|nr:DUF434 domain-containing protein [Sedimentisphaerales bacterium]
MPDKRKHRGPHPQDSNLFCTENIGDLRCAAADYSLLLTKGYPENASLKLVGDKFALTERQRLAVMRSSCSDAHLANRLERRIDTVELTNKDILIDGYNILITIEAALSGAFIFIGRDGCMRDLAGMHGTYRKVNETIPAIELINKALGELKTNSVHWLLDKPVSNSGKLKKIIESQTTDSQPEVTLINNPDDALVKSEKIIATSDSIVLDKAKSWANLTKFVIEKFIDNPSIIDLRS